MIRILSDLHLGHASSRIQDASQLAPLFEGCEKIVFAGDVWQAKKGTHPGCHDIFEELKSLVGARGVYLRGNHDPESGEGIAWLAGRRVLVTHGDAVLDEATPWAREMPRFRDEVRAIVARYDRDDPQACSDRAKEIAITLKPRPFLKIPPPFNFFASALWPPTRPFEMIRVWSTLGEECHRFLKRVAPETGVLVCGHFHRTGFWEKEGRLVINTGSYMRGSTAWCVDLTDDWLLVREVVSEEGWQAGQVIGRWRY